MNLKISVHIVILIMDAAENKTPSSNDKHDQGILTRSQLSSERKNLTIDSLADLLVEMEHRLPTSFIKANNSTTDKLCK